MFAVHFKSRYTRFVRKFFLFIPLLLILAVVGFFVLRYLDYERGINLAYVQRLLTYRNCYKTGDQKVEGDSEMGIEGILVNYDTYYTVEPQGGPVSYRFTNIIPGSAIGNVMEMRAGSLKDPSSYDRAAVDTKFVEHNFFIENGVQIPDPNMLKRSSVHDTTLLSICFK